MNNRLRLAIGWLSVIGGAAGMVAMLMLLFSTGRLLATTAAVLALALGYFSLGVYAGASAIQNRPDWPHVAFAYWLLQIPLVSISSFSYYSNALVGLWVFASTEPRVGASFYLGSQVQLAFGGPRPFGPFTVIGLNLAAFVVAAALAHSL